MVWPASSPSREKRTATIAIDLDALAALVDSAEADAQETPSPQTDAVTGDTPAGQATLDSLLAEIRALKQEGPFLTLFKDPAAQKRVADLSVRLSSLLQREQARLANAVGSLEPHVVDIISTRIEALKDMRWCLDVELAGNIGRIRSLMPGSDDRRARQPHHRLATDQRRAQQHRPA